MIDVDDIDSEMYRVGGYIAGLTGMEKDREKPGVDPGVWFLAVATLAEIVRCAALEAFEEWAGFCYEVDEDLLGNDIVNEVKRSVLDAVDSPSSDCGSEPGGGS